MNKITNASPILPEPEPGSVYQGNFTREYFMAVSDGRAIALLDGRMITAALKSEGAYRRIPAGESVTIEVEKPDLFFQKRSTRDYFLFNSSEIKIA